MVYLEAVFIDDEKEHEEDYSWECLKQGREYHQSCKDKTCQCDCHWADPEEM